MTVTNDMILKYDKLARFVVKEYKGRNYYDDVVQEARIGIWKGLQTYKEDGAASALTYLAKCARREVGHYFNAMFATKNPAYNNIHHETDGTAMTVSIDSIIKQADGSTQYLYDFVGKDDSNLDDICWRDAIDKSLKKVFSNDKKTSRKQHLQDIYRDYINLSNQYGVFGVVPSLCKKYSLSRQRVHQIIQDYNERMKKEIAPYLY